MTFKRKITTLAGGEYKNKHGGALGTHCNVETQPVEIVTADAGEDEDGETLVIVRTYGAHRATLIVPESELSPAPGDRMTNSEAMAEMMDWASSPLVHVFIFDAIGKFADQVLADPDATRAAMAGGFIGGQAWLDAAAEAKAKVEAHLKG